MKDNHSIPWQSKPIESVVIDCTGGQTKILRSDYETTGAFPVIDQGKEFSNGFTSDESKLYRGKLPLVLFGDHTREIKFVDQPFALGADGVKALEPKPILAAKFLYYYLLKSPVEARGYSRHFKYLKEKSVPLPPIPEQDRIVEILDLAYTLRQQRRQADALSQRILPALFHEMFGDVMAAHENWPSKCITEVCWPRQWPTISGKQLLPKGYPVFGANGLIGYYDSFNHEHPTIAITCRGATCGTINLTQPKCYLTGNAMALDDLDESLITQEFMIAFLESRGLQDVITGAAQPQITRTNLEKVKIPLVPSDLLMKFTERSKSLTSARSNAATSAATLETLFQTLLHRAFDGSLTAKWREGHAKEVLQEMKRQSRT